MRTKLAVFLALLMAISIALFLFNRPPLLTELEYGQQAKQAAEQDNWEAVRVIAGQWRKAYPNSYVPYAAMGDALRQLDQDAEAVTEYEQYLKFDQKNPEVWASYGVSLFGIGRAEESIKACRKAKDLAPQLAIAWYCLAIAVGMDGQKEETLAATEQLAKLNPMLSKDFIERILPEHICPVAQDKLGQPLCSTTNRPLP